MDNVLLSNTNSKLPFSGKTSEDAISNDHVMSSVRLAKKYGDSARSGSKSGLGAIPFCIDPSELNELDAFISNERHELGNRRLRSDHSFIN